MGMGNCALKHLRHSSTRKALRYCDTKDTWALENSNTWALGHSKKILDTQLLKALSYLGTEALEALYSADSID